jgi:hypothetical protein
MSAADKLQELAKMFGAASRVRPQVASIVAEPSQTNAIATENTTVDSVPVKLESAMATPAPEAERKSEATTANQPNLPMSNLDLDTAIRLRWALRDIKAKRTILTPVSPTDLTILIEMRLVEMRDDALMLTNEGHQTLAP